MPRLTAPAILSLAVVASTLFAALGAPDVAQARGRGRSSPYVMTPDGPVLKSVYYGQNLQIADPAMIARMQQQEQKLMAGKGKKPTTTAGSKNTAGKPNTANKK